MNDIEYIKKLEEVIMIDTEKIKENGWKYAGDCQNIIIDDDILSEMRGTNKEYCKEFIKKRFNNMQN